MLFFSESYTPSGNLSTDISISSNSGADNFNFTL